MQGSCKHGKHGSNCPFPHPPMCFKLIGKGSKGCDKGSLCTHAHPKVCQASVSNRRCNIKICNLYYVSGSLRPNHPGTSLEKHSDNKLEKRHLLTPLMQIKLPVHEKRSQLSTLSSNPIYQSQSTQPCVPIQPSLPPYQTQSHNAPPTSQKSHIPSPALQQPSFDVFRSNSEYETSNVPDAAGPKFNVAKSHEQHVAKAAWSEDLPSNTTMPAKLSSPISPNCMFSFLFMNIAHLYAKYRQKNKLLAHYCDSSTMFICLCKTFLHEGILDSEVQITGFIIARSDRVHRPGGLIQHSLNMIC